MIDLGVFLVGAACGAALSYLKDRRLLHLYGDLVRELSGALQEQVEHLPGDAEAPHQLGAIAGFPSSAFIRSATCLGVISAFTT